MQIITSNSLRKSIIQSLFTKQFQSSEFLWSCPVYMYRMLISVCLKQDEVCCNYSQTPFTTKVLLLTDKWHPKRFHCCVYIFIRHEICWPVFCSVDNLRFCNLQVKPFNVNNRNFRFMWKKVFFSLAKHTPTSKHLKLVIWHDLLKNLGICRTWVRAWPMFHCLRWLYRKSNPTCTVNKEAKCDQSNDY